MHVPIHSKLGKEAFQVWKPTGARNKGPWSLSSHTFRTKWQGNEQVFLGDFISGKTNYREENKPISLIGVLDMHLSKVFLLLIKAIICLKTI
jgi:hypothetical protein